MKNYIFIMLSFIIFSCEKDDSLDPRPDRVAGQFVTLQIITGRIDNANIATSSFEGIIDAPGKNVDKYELYVAKRNGFGFVSDFVLLQTITSFPYELKVNAASIAAVGLGNIELSNQIRFYGKSYKDGVVADFNNLAGVLRTSQSQKQGYKFYTDVSNQPNVPLDNQYTW